MDPLALIATSFGFALVQLDVSILNVALARMGASLGAGISGLQWVVDAYAIAFASLLLGAGALGDRFGARRAYIAGLTIFTLASLACGLAPGAGVLIAARVVQGAGAALLVPCSLALLTHACGTDEAARTRAISLWTAAASVSLSAGPLLGGLLVNAIGWRGIFFVNLPLGVGGIWLTRRFVKETPHRHGALDPAGQILAVLSLAGLTAAVIEAGHLGVAAPPVDIGFAFAALCGVAFVLVESHVADPMLPLGFFRNATFGAASAVGLAINLTLYGTIFVQSLYLQQTLHYTPLAAGIAFLPLPIALGLTNIAAGRAFLRYAASFRLVTGLLIAASGFLLLSHLGSHSSYLSLLPGLVLIPAGIGLAVPLMTSALLSTVPHSHSGSASGVLNTVRQAAGAIGVALFGAMLAAHGVAGFRAALLLSALLLAGAAAVAALGMRQPVTAVRRRCSPSAPG